MNGKNLVLAVIAVGVSLGTLTATLGGMMLSGQNALRRDVSSLQSDVADLRERMARLEGRVDTMVILFEGHVSGDCGE